MVGAPDNFGGAPAVFRVLGATLIPVEVHEAGLPAALATWELKRDFERYLARLPAGAPIRTLDELIRFNDDNLLTEGAAPYGQEALRKANAVDLNDPAVQAEYHAHRELVLETARERLDAAFAASGSDVLLFFHATAHKVYARAKYPAVTIRIGYDPRTGQPLGATVVGKPGAEADLLRIAHDYEQEARVWRPPSEINPALFKGLAWTRSRRKQVPTTDGAADSTTRGRVVAARSDGDDRSQCARIIARHRYRTGTPSVVVADVVGPNGWSLTSLVEASGGRLQRTPVEPEQPYRRVEQSFRELVADVDPRERDGMSLIVIDTTRLGEHELVGDTSRWEYRYHERTQWDWFELQDRGTPSDDHHFHMTTDREVHGILVMAFDRHGESLLLPDAEVVTIGVSVPDFAIGQGRRPEDAPGEVRAPLGSPRVVAFGGATIDIIVDHQEFPADGEYREVSSIRETAGGKALNQAVAAARLGAKADIVTAVGHDGHDIRETLRREGVGHGGVRVENGVASEKVLCLVGPDGESSFVRHAARELELTGDDIRANLETIENADVVLLASELSPAIVSDIATVARAHGAKVVLQPAPRERVSLDAVRMADILVPNEKEARALLSVAASDAETIPAEQLPERLFELLGIPVIVVTLGAAGCAVHHDERTEVFPAHPTRVVDATGASDAFTAALAMGMAAGLPVRRAVQLGLSVAAQTVARSGGAESMPYARDLSGALPQPSAESRAVAPRPTPWSPRTSEPQAEASGSRPSTPWSDDAITVEWFTAATDADELQDDRTCFRRGLDRVRAVTGAAVGVWTPEEATGRGVLPLPAQRAAGGVFREVATWGLLEQKLSTRAPGTTFLVVHWPSGVLDAPSVDSVDSRTAHTVVLTRGHAPEALEFYEAGADSVRGYLIGKRPTDTGVPPTGNRLVVIEYGTDGVVIPASGPALLPPLPIADTADSRHLDAARNPPWSNDESFRSVVARAEIRAGAVFRSDHKPGYVIDGIRRFDSHRIARMYGDKYLSSPFHSLTDDQRMAVLECVANSYAYQHFLRPTGFIDPAVAERELREFHGDTKDGWSLFELYDSVPTLSDIRRAARRPDLTSVQRDIVTRILGSADPWRELQKTIRRPSSAGMRGTLTAAFGKWPTLADLRKRINTVNRAVRHPLPEGLEVHRGLREAAFMLDGNSPYELVGTTWIEPGFTSASLGSGPVAVADTDPAVELHISVPKGVEALWIGPNGPYPEQNEVLFGQGLGIRITKVRRHGGKWHLFGKVVRYGGMAGDAVRTVDLE
ncbi:PfkB family carbohydrate kinase [Nocardia sp. N2S4-5]|uniref:PfkB family carbohydrate kinase n=1 Tax=Nocardia sp. N2S4-5 TaxID=3351565 RepID=UPI0037CE8C19